MVIDFWKMLLNIIDCSCKSYEDIIKEIDKIKLELNSYDESLLKKDKWIVINKIDMQIGEILNLL